MTCKKRGAVIEIITEFTQNMQRTKTGVEEATNPEGKSKRPCR